MDGAAGAKRRYLTMPRSRQIYFYVGKRAHPLYCEQFLITPRGFTYVPSNPDLAHPPEFSRQLVRRRALRGRIGRSAKKAAVTALAVAGHIRSVSVRPPPDTALTHSAQFLLKDAAKPYVVDFEDIHVFSLYQALALDRPWGRRRLLELLQDPACRYLLPWTDTARRGFLAMIDARYRSGLAARTITVRPAIRPTVQAPARRARGPLRVIFIGASFFEKGAVEAVSAVRRARSSHDIELDLVTTVPPSWHHAFGEDEAIRVHEGLSSACLRRLYQESHALLFPTHIDTFGYVVLEAFAAATPVLAPNHHALPEMVTDGISGLLFRPENSFFLPSGRPRFRLFAPPVAGQSFLRALGKPSDAYVEGIAQQLARLAEDTDLVERLAAGALEEVTQGRFSVERRQKQLEMVYELALRSGDGAM
jgi:glycosyltransferase involved in cell wall biosynthesis